MEAVVLERSIVIAADRERVWRAITTPEHLAKWFEPIRFERLAVGETLTFGWGGEGSIALVELETVPEGTRITVTEQGFEALPDEVREIRFQDNTQGWEHMLDSLSAYMTSREP
ncbi:MAG: hypothetical protein AUH05_11870 [Ktedonobacter sp. 13_2_20CM_53_11]|nr:MAG: hypothetical protein AUH05_11870 [Ktedonobacter sp. 13_2_20CM_53_11]